MQTCGRAVDFVVGYDIETNMLIIVVSNGLATIPGLVASLVRKIDTVVKSVHLNWATIQIACAPRTGWIVVLIVRTIIQRVLTATGLRATFGHFTVRNVIAETLINIMIASTAVCILVDAIGSLIDLFWAARIRRTTTEALSSLFTRIPW